MMTNWAHELLDRVSRKILDRGESYYRQGRVMEMVRRDTKYEARVTGSQPKPYQVRINTDNGRLDGYFCDCPDDWNPICKHITAVTLAYDDDPEQFEQRPTAEDRLRNYNRDELLQLVTMMLEREPSLKRLLDHPLPGEASSDDLGDPDSYRGEILDLLDRFREPGMERELAREFGNILDRVENYMEHENHGEAYALLRAFLETVVENYDRTHDHGHISTLIHYGTELSIDLLETFKNSDEKRSTMIEFIYSLCEWSIQWGGYGLREIAIDPLIDYSTKPDRDRLRELVRKSIRDLDRGPRGWSRNSFGKFLLELYEEDHDRSSFLEDAQNLGLSKLRAECLIQEGKIDEAVETAKKGINHVKERIKVANQLLDAGYPDKAGELIYDISDKMADLRLLRWLSEYEEEYGTIERALEIEWDQLEQKPTFDRYQRIMHLSDEIGLSDKQHRKLIEFFEKNNEVKVLARIHLEKENWDQAWDYVDEYREKQGTRSRKIAEEAAQQSEDERPNRALEFYRDRARHLIDRRGRDNYREAANCLNKIRTLCRDHEVERQWQDLVDEFYEYASNLPACKDEFQKAGIE
jgi:uncharacterized Zn finger protein